MDKADRDYLELLLSPITKAVDRSVKNSEQALAEAITTRQQLDFIQVVQKESNDRLATLGSEVSAVTVTNLAIDSRLDKLEKWISGNGRPPVEARLTSVEERFIAHTYQCSSMHKRIDDSVASIERAVTSQKRAKMSLRLKVLIATIGTVGVLGAAAITRVECQRPYDTPTPAEVLHGLESPSEILPTIAPEPAGP